MLRLKFIIAYHWIYAKVYVKRTQISIGGEQDRDTLIEQLPYYCNRTFCINSAMEIVQIYLHLYISINPFIEVHWCYLQGLYCNAHMRH